MSNGESDKRLPVIDGYLRYQRRVPADLQTVIGQKHWILSRGLSEGQEHHAAKIIADSRLQSVR